MTQFVTMEIHSQNDHPGEEMLDNREQFLIRIKTQPFQNNIRRKRIKSYIYLFICPIFPLSNEPLASLPELTAPFCFETIYCQYKPAYLVHKGRIHLGIQVQRILNEIDILIRLAVRAPQEINQNFRFEPAQILLFDNSGSFIPIDVKTIVIYHNPSDFAVINTGDIERPCLSAPLPYYHSPCTQELSTPLAPVQTPTLITIGDTDNLFTGLYDSICLQQTPILDDILAFNPQISHTVKIYLLPFLNKESWLSPDLITILNFELHKHIPRGVTCGTQTNLTKTDACTQTDNKEDAELKAILDDLFSPLPPSPPIAPPQVLFLTIFT